MGNIQSAINQFFSKSVILGSIASSEGYILRKEKENKRAQQLATQQLKQKMSFDEFKNLLTVKDLPKPMQEKEYNEYTSKK